MAVGIHTDAVEGGAAHRHVVVLLGLVTPVVAALQAECQRARWSKAPRSGCRRWRRRVTDDGYARLSPAPEPEAAPDQLEV